MKLNNHNWKICFIGLGSIGTRHIHNIVKVMERHEDIYKIHAVRSCERKLPNDIEYLLDKIYYEVQELPNDYDIIFVTNPTYLHYDVIRQVLEKTKNMFIEKPIFHKLISNWRQLPWKEEGIYYVACPIRHNPVYAKVKELISSDKVIGARAICSSYLPTWRNSTDYRNSYSANKELGGGVTLDLIHEWDYLVDLFGTPMEMSHMEGQFSNLELQCEDISSYMARYDDKLVELHIDYIGHREERKLTIFTNEKRMDVDFIEQVVCLYEKNQLVETYEYRREDIYMNEMEYFWDCITGKVENINTVERAVEVLNVALAKNII